LRCGGGTGLEASGGQVVTEPLNLLQIEDLAARIREEIPEQDRLGDRRHYHHARKRVEADLLGLRRHSATIDNDCIRCEEGNWCADRFAYQASLLRTAKEYGVRTP